MNRCYFGLGCAAAAASLLAAPAFASTSITDCATRPGGLLTHVIRVQEEGFFPTTTYVCPGDTVKFVNGHYNWANFYLNWGTHSDWSNWRSPGLEYDDVDFVVTATTSVQFERVGAHPYYPTHYDSATGTNRSYSAYLQFGVAPNSLDELD